MIDSQAVRDGATEVGTHADRAPTLRSRVSTRLSWREGVEVEEAEAGAICVRSAAARFVLRPENEQERGVLAHLAGEGADEETLADALLESGGPPALSRWYFMLERLASRGFLVRSVHEGEARLATLMPLVPSFRLAPVVPQIDPNRVLQLSRFAYLRRAGSQLVLESPTALARVVFDDPRAAMLFGVLANPGTLEEHYRLAPSLSAAGCAAIRSLLRSAGMLDDAEEGEPHSLHSWEFHDLLYHARSRKGRSDAPFGAAFRREAGFGPPPAFAERHGTESITLYRPALKADVPDAPTFIEVLESRQSVREYGERPITIQQLGEFLYRVARVKEVREIEMETPHGTVPLEVASRPFPAGGSLYELEFTIAAQTCEGLQPALYHYNPREHRLEKVRGRSADLDHLVRDAAGSAAIPPESVQVVVILSSRLRRLSWKYASIAYALTLKHVGVVYQTMYLVATAMNLAPCALGGGDADLFARAAGLDYFDESSVGEFLLGSRR